MEIKRRVALIFMRDCTRNQPRTEGISTCEVVSPSILLVNRHYVRHGIICNNNFSSFRPLFLYEVLLIYVTNHSNFYKTCMYTVSYETVLCIACDINLDVNVTV